MSTSLSTFDVSQLAWPLPDVGDAGPGPEDQRALLAALATTQVDWSLFGQHLAFDPECYVRRRLFLNESWEMLLLCWLPGQKTAIHDHGASWGATLVLTGDLVESQYRWEGEGRPMRHRSDNALGTHQITVETHDTIHVVSNRGAAPAASLHLYSPPLTYLHAYDPEVGTKNRVEPSETRFFTR